MQGLEFLILLVILFLFAYRLVVRDLDKKAARSQKKDFSINSNPVSKVNIFVSDRPLNPYERMLLKATRRIEQNPNDFVAYSDRGAALLMLKRYDEAMPDLNRSIELKPDFADAYSNRGLLYYAQEKEQQAVEDYNRAIQLKADDPVYYFNRGQSLIKLGEYAKATADLNRALELNPKFSGALLERGRSYYLQNDKKRALEDFRAFERISLPIIADPLIDRDIVRMYLEIEDSEKGS